MREYAERPRRWLSHVRRILEVPSSNFGRECVRPDVGVRRFWSVLPRRCRDKVQVNVLHVHTTEACRGAE
jgi:hypothetical protein